MYVLLLLLFLLIPLERIITEHTNKERLLENESSYFCADGSQQAGKCLSRGNHSAAAGISGACITVNFYPKSASSVYML